MTETFILILIGMIFSFVLILYTIRSIYTKIISDKYLKESKKLQLLVNNLKREYGELVEEPQDFIGGAISQMGVEGLLKQFGIDPGILNNPIVQGFISKYAPKMMEQLQGGVKPGAKMETSASQV